MHTTGHGNEPLGQPIPGFRLMAARNPADAHRVLNDPNLPFPTLYIHAADIRRFDLYEGLIPRNLVGLKLIARKQRDLDLAKQLEQMLPQEGDEIRLALVWIIQTGAAWDGPHRHYDPYDAVIDAAAARLVREYDDTTTLPVIADLIFRRNRQGLLVHDLVWSFFQSTTPDAVALIAEYLLSDEPEDFILACKLLHISLPKGDVGPGLRQSIHNGFIQWLRDNDGYVFFTREHFQETSEPTPLDLDPGAKYLGKRISPATKVFIEDLTEAEKRRLEEFRQFPENEQKILAVYSHDLRKTDRDAWQVWMDQSPGIQVATLRAQGGIKG